MSGYRPGLEIVMKVSGDRDEVAGKTLSSHRNLEKSGKRPPESGAAAETWRGRQSLGG